MSDAEQHGMAVSLMDGPEGHTTMTVPHRKVKGRRWSCSPVEATFYYCQYPEGDYFIHCAFPGDKNGYCGDWVAFLLTDGSVDVVKGPYCETGSYDDGASECLAQIVGDDAIRLKANRIQVGRNLFATKSPEVVHEEAGWSLSDWTERLRPEWAGLEVRIFFRGGSCLPNKKMLEPLFATGEEADHD